MFLCLLPTSPPHLPYSPACSLPSTSELLSGNSRLTILTHQLTAQAVAPLCESFLSLSCINPGIPIVGTSLAHVTRTPPQGLEGGEQYPMVTDRGARLIRHWPSQYFLSSSLPQIRRLQFPYHIMPPMNNPARRLYFIFFAFTADTNPELDSIENHQLLPISHPVTIASVSWQNVIDYTSIKHIKMRTLFKSRQLRVPFISNSVLVFSSGASSAWSLTTQTTSSSLPQTTFNLLASNQLSCTLLIAFYHTVVLSFF